MDNVSATFFLILIFSSPSKDMSKGMESYNLEKHSNGSKRVENKSWYGSLKSILYSVKWTMDSEICFEKRNLRAKFVVGVGKFGGKVSGIKTTMW